MNKANKKAYTRTEGEYEKLESQLAEAREEAKRTKDAIKLNFVDVKRTKCCTDTALWILDKLKEKGE